MIPANTLPPTYTARLAGVLDDSWRIFKTRFLDGRHKVTTEAPFQHHFANVIRTIGQESCSTRKDAFFVDLETRIDKLKGKRKFIDITCGYAQRKAKCAIELKFKTARQGAQDWGRIDAFVDIEALELVLRQGYDFGRFYMITDSTPYIKKSKKGVGTVFTTHDGARTAPNSRFHCPTCKGKENVVVKFANGYHFNWEKSGKWYFLQLAVPPRAG